MSELDPLGRTPLAAGMKAQIEATLREIPDGKRAALLVVADETGARAVVAAKIGPKGDWKIAAGLGTAWREPRPSGWVSVQGSW
jgi:Mg-chelatase subunit ChlD